MTWSGGGECVPEFVSDWPLVVASNISAILHSPWGQNSLHCTQPCPLLNWVVAKCVGLVWLSLQSTDSKRGRLKSRSHRAAGGNSILRPVTFWILARVSSSGRDHRAKKKKKNRNGHTEFEVSECTQGRREVTIDWGKGWVKEKKMLLRSQKLSLRLRRLLSSSIQQWSSNIFLFCATPGSQQELGTRLQLRDVFSAKPHNKCTNGQSIVYLWGTFPNEAHHETPQRSEILKLYSVRSTVMLCQSLFISPWTDSHFLTSANTLALCCCDEKVSFAPIKIPSRNKPSVAWQREIPCGASHLQCRDWNADIFTLTISYVASRWLIFLSTGGAVCLLRQCKLSVVVMIIITDLLNTEMQWRAVCFTSRPWVVLRLNPTPQKTNTRHYLPMPVFVH